MSPEAFLQKYEGKIAALPQSISGDDYALYMMLSRLLHDLRQGGWTRAEVERCVEREEHRQAPLRVGRRVIGKQSPYERKLWAEVKADVLSTVKEQTS